MASSGLKRAAVVTTAVLAIAVDPVALASGPLPEVTLKTSRSTLTFGTRTVLSGHVSSRAAGQTVRVVDEAGAVVAEATTNERGRYSVAYRPRANVMLRAHWLVAVSDPVTIGVRSRLDLGVAKLRLFHEGRAVGTLRPRQSGASVRVRVRAGGRAIFDGRVRVHDSGRFVAPFSVREIASYRIKASFDDSDHLPAREALARRTRAPALSTGSRGPAVKMLERRLLKLGYYLPRADSSYDERTGDAVIAFNKVQGRARESSVSSATWADLARPIAPKPRSRADGFHIEIDQTKQVLLAVRDGEVEHILHTSTGAGGATPDGSFSVSRKLAGYSGGGLYYPSYFNGTRAIHGWSEVPTYPASHGCSRVPMWAAQWIYRLADIGTDVLIYH